MGDSVNLAARLCSKAASNSICVSKTFMKKIIQNNPEIKVIKSESVTDLKGFENETIDIYHLRPSKALTPNSAECPVCKGHLSVEADLGTSLYMKCNSCGYIDLHDKLAKKKVA